jgi:hypothetical protein
LQRVVLREAKAIQEREKSVTLAALIDDYIQKLHRSHRLAEPSSNLEI